VIITVANWFCSISPSITVFISDVGSSRVISFSQDIINIATNVKRINLIFDIL